MHEDFIRLLNEEKSELQNKTLIRWLAQALILKTGIRWKLVITTQALLFGDGWMQLYEGLYQP